MKRLSVLACLLLFLGGCASLPKGPGCVAIGPAGAACLLPPAALPALDAQHLVTVNHDGRTDSFLGDLHVDEHALRLVGSSLFGTPLFELAWDGRTLHMQPADADMHPQRMLALLQAALADPARLRPRLHGIELTVKADPHGGQWRTLTEHGHQVARIHIGAGPLAGAALRIEVPAAGLNLDLTPLPSDPESP